MLSRSEKRRLQMIKPHARSNARRLKSLFDELRPPAVIIKAHSKCGAPDANVVDRTHHTCFRRSML